MTEDTWAELHRLRAEAKGPDGFLTWKDAAIDERLKRVAAEQAIKDAENLRTVAINLIAACEEREGDDGERCYLVPAQEFDDLQELLND